VFHQVVPTGREPVPEVNSLIHFQYADEDLPDFLKDELLQPRTHFVEVILNDKQDVQEVRSSVDLHLLESQLQIIDDADGKYQCKELHLLGVPRETPPTPQQPHTQQPQPQTSMPSTHNLRNQSQPPTDGKNTTMYSNYFPPRNTQYNPSQHQQQPQQHTISDDGIGVNAHLQLFEQRLQAMTEGAVARFRSEVEAQAAYFMELERKKFHTQ
jgi:hypothetical protein